MVYKDLQRFYIATHLSQEAYFYISGRLKAKKAREASQAASTKVIGLNISNIYP